MRDWKKIEFVPLSRVIPAVKSWAHPSRGIVTNVSLVGVADNFNDALNPSAHFGLLVEGTLDGELVHTVVSPSVWHYWCTRTSHVSEGVKVSAGNAEWVKVKTFKEVGS